MKAVNLIPVDRRRSSGGVGRSGGAVYVVLGALGGLLLLATLYAVASHQVADRKAQLVKATQDTAAAQARAQQLAPYKQFSDMRTQREHAVSSLAGTRFDWPTAMRNVASALPPGVVLGTFTGIPAGANGAGAGGASAAPAPPPSSTAAPGSGPNVHLTGCATSHTQVGDVINRLRGVPGVTSVTFTSSSKGGGGAGAASTTTSSSANSGPCGPGGPQFDLTAYFSGVSAASGSAGAHPAPPAATPTASAASAQPPTATGGHR